MKEAPVYKYLFCAREWEYRQ